MRQMDCAAGRRQGSAGGCDAHAGVEQRRRHAGSGMQAAVACRRQPTIGFVNRGFVMVEVQTFSVRFCMGHGAVVGLQQRLKRSGTGSGGGGLNWPVRASPSRPP